MSCDIYLYMLLIVLLFADWGICFGRKEKQFLRKIRSLRKKNCANKHKESEKNAKKQKLKKKKKIYRVCKNICFIFSAFVFWITVILLIGNKIVMLVKPVVIQNQVDTMLMDMGVKIRSFNPIESLNSGRKTEDVVENLFSALPCWELYNVNSESKEKKRQSYVDAISEEIGSKENWTLEKYVVINPEDEKESEKYKKNKELLDAMELDRVPEGYSLEDVQKGEIPPLPITADTSMREANMRWENYYIKPDVFMLQQASKASADTAIGFSENGGLIEMTVKHAGYAVNGYLCLMRYECAGESKADCCFWIAKILRILSDTMPKEWEGLVEHCEMLSYAFCELGVRYLDELNETNDHIDELLLLREEMDVRTR